MEIVKQSRAKIHDPYGYSSCRLAIARRRSRACTLGPQSDQDRGKLTVVLDVDETLVHSRLDAEQSGMRQEEDGRPDEVRAVDEFRFTLPDGVVLRANKRPGLDAFLEEASKTYELIAYTAGTEAYARPLLAALDPKGTIFRHHLYRDSCLLMRGCYVKDLAKLNRPMHRVLLVDNNPVSFLAQLCNSIPISSFYDDPHDVALSALSEYLDVVQHATDVRPHLQSSFGLDTLLHSSREAVLG